MQTSIPVQTNPPETAVTAALRALAGAAGWCVTHTTDGKHSANSLHYSGRAVDLASTDGPGVDTPQLAQIAQDVLARVPLSQISEVIWAGPNPVYVKNGVRVNGLAVYGSTVLSEHHNHVHLGVVPNYTYSVPAPTPAGDWTEEVIMALPTLSVGSTGQHVRNLQALLIVAANDLIHEKDIDGNFGPGTASVLKTWQARTKVLTADGVCGPATWRWLIG